MEFRDPAPRRLRLRIMNTVVFSVINNTHIRAASYNIVQEMMVYGRDKPVTEFGIQIWSI